MSRSIFFSIWLVLLASCDKMDISPSQAETFIKFYNTYPVFTGADVKETPNKGYAMIGTVETTTAGKQICLIRTDKYGNSLDTARYYGGQLDDEAHCLQVLSDHGLAILGTTTDPASERKEVYLIRTDSVGNIIWSRIISNTYNIEANRFVVDDAGSFFMVGYGETTRQGGAVNKDIWLFAVNADGTDRWPEQRFIGYNKDDVGNDLQLLSDKRIVITGQTTNSLGTNAFAMITNNTGLGGSFLQKDTAIFEVGNSIQVINSNSFIIAGTTKNNLSTTGTDVFLKRVTFTPTGLRTDWRRIFEKTGNDAGVYVILAASNLHVLATTSSGGINSTISLITTDLDGNNPAINALGEYSQLSGSSIQQTTDNGFIIAGTNKHSDNDISMALIKLNQQGLLK
jgi:hypothetical protein